MLGVPAALGVTVLATFSPNLIAHSRVAAADLGCAFFMFAAVAAFWWAAQTGQLRRWFACGALTGLALISKFTALVLGPTYVLLVARRRRSRTSVHASIMMIIVGTSTALST